MHLPRSQQDRTCRSFRFGRARAFTLIELILVMALLTVAFGISFPVLRGFFHGRVLDSEVRRLLSLTRYGQNRAIAEGIPMILWIDERAGMYGLEAAVTYESEDPLAMEFQLDDDLVIDTANPPPPIPGTVIQEWKPRNRRSTLTGKSLTGLPMIRMLPDGFIDPSSPEYVEVRQGEKDAYWLAQTTNRLRYELRAQRPPPIRR